MKPSTMLIVGGVGVAAYFFFSKKASAQVASPQSKPTYAGGGTASNASSSGTLLLGALDKILGATWNVLPNSVQTIDYTKQGYAIGDYAGLTQTQANQQATNDYNDQFISPWGKSPFAY